MRISQGKKQVLKKLLITAVALFNITYLTIAYSDNALPVEAKALNSNTDPTGQWVSVLSNLPIQTGNLEYIEFNKKLYAAGAEYITDKALMYVYNGDNKNPKWTSVGTGLPVDGNIAALGIYNNALYVAGYGGYAIGFIFRYNGDDQHPSWTPVSMAGLSQRTFMPSHLMEYNNKMYITDDNSFSSPIFVYDDKKQSWSPVANDLDRIDAMTVFHDKLYVVDRDSSRLAAYVYNGNDDAPSWKLISPNWSSYQASYGFTLSVSNDTLFVAGQNADDGSFVYAYNGDDQNPNWRDVSNGLPNQPNHYDTWVTSLTVSNNTLYAGGVIWSSGSPFVYVYNGNNDAPNWTSVGNNGLPLALMDVSLTAFNNTFYMGGQRRNNNGKLFLYALSLPSQQVSAVK